MLWYLTNLPTPLLREVFYGHSHDALRSKRKLYNRKIREGKETMPPRPVDFRDSDTAEMIRARLDRKNTDANDKLAPDVVKTRTREYLHKLLDETLDKVGIDPAQVSKFRVSAGTHEGYIKNQDGEIEYTKELQHGGINLIVEPEKFTPQWPLIDRPPISVLPVTVRQPKNRSKQKTCVVIPDPQIGYRRFVDGTIDPFHDISAISIALQIIADIKPDKVVCLGDYLDLPMFGRFEQSEDYAHTAQLAIDFGYKMLAKIRQSVPHAEMAVIEGNHDRRIQNNITNTNMSAFGMRRAEDTTGWPVFSVPYLLNFDSLNIEYVEGYPAGAYWINERLQCIHGRIVGPAGQTAAKVVKAESVSTIFGHIHRIETAYDTINIYGGAKQNIAHSPGCLCRIDGGVPSAKGSTHLNGRPLKYYENWQQGMAVVDYEDGDKPFSLHPIQIDTINNYYTTYGGKVYAPDPSLLD